MRGGETMKKALLVSAALFVLSLVYVAEAFAHGMPHVGGY